MSAVLQQEAPAQYRVQAYKKAVAGQSGSTIQMIPCMREEADAWWIERLVGPDRWARVEMRDEEAAARRRMAEISGQIGERTHYGYSTPRR